MGKVAERSPQKVRIVVEAAQRLVALRAEEASHGPRGVAVIDAQLVVLVRLDASADRAATPLLGQSPLVLLQRHAVPLDASLHLQALGIAATIRDLLIAEVALAVFLALTRVVAGLAVVVEAVGVALVGVEHRDG